MNDEGWDTTFVHWLEGRASAARRGPRVLGRAAGTERSGVSTNLVRALELAGRVGASDLRGRRARRRLHPRGGRRLRRHPSAERRARHAAHRGSVRRRLAPPGHPPGAQGAGHEVGIGAVTGAVRGRFFIVGGAGFIGSHFVDRLLGRPAVEPGHGLRQLLVRAGVAPRPSPRTTRASASSAATSRTSGASRGDGGPRRGDPPRVRTPTSRARRPSRTSTSTRGRCLTQNVVEAMRDHAGERHPLRVRQRRVRRPR